MRVKVIAEVDIDVSDLDPKFVDMEGFVKDEARRIMIEEPEFYEFDYKIIKEENQMDEMICEWLKQMYDREIENSQCDINNENLWILGSQTKEEEKMHIENMERLKEYIKVLKELKGDK